IGRVHNVALSTLQNFRLPGDVSASKRYWKEDIVEPEVEVSAQGSIAISDAPGTGYRVRRGLIEKLTVRKETFALSRCDGSAWASTMGDYCTSFVTRKR